MEKMISTPRRKLIIPQDFKAEIYGPPWKKMERETGRGRTNKEKVTSHETIKSYPKPRNTSRKCKTFSNDKLIQACSSPPDPPFHVQPKPIGTVKLPRLLLIKPEYS